MENRLHLLTPMLIATIIVVISVTSACQSQVRTNNLENGPLRDNAPPQTQLTANEAGNELESATFPNDFVLVCQDDVGIQYWRYDAIEQAWDSKRANLSDSRDFVVQGLFPLQDAASFLIYGINVTEGEEDQFQIFLWQDGQEKLVFSAENRYTVLPHLSVYSPSPTHNYLYANKMDNPYALFWLDADSCRADGCEFSPVSELSLRSPLGGKELIWDPETWTIQIRSALGQNGEEIDAGGAPFWLDENRIGYLRPTGSLPHLGGTHSELVVQQLNNASGSRVVLDTERLKSLLTEEGFGNNPDDIILINARGSASQPNTVLVSATDPNTPEYAILFRVDLQTDQVVYVPGLTAASLHQLELSPNEHFLVVPALDTIYLYSLVTGEVINYPWRKQSSEMDMARRHAFSAAGEWLLLPSGATTSVAQTSAGNMVDFSLVGQNCTFGIWLEAKNLAER